MSNDPTRPLPAGYANQMNQGYRQDPPQAETPYRRRRKRWPMISLITLILLAGLAVGGDRIAASIAENQMATQIQQSGFPVKPGVSIEGFPFLTQLLGHKFDHVVISASNVPEDPLVISSLHVDLLGMHISGDYKSATIDNLSGTALISFADLASAGGVPQGITLGPGDAPNQIKATINIDVISTDVNAEVTRVGADKIRVHVLDAGGVPSQVLGNFADFTVSVPKLPAGLQMQGIAVTQQGVQITVTGHHTVLGQ